MARRKSIFAVGTITLFGVVGFLYSEWEKCDSAGAEIGAAVATLARYAERTGREAEQSRVRDSAAWDELDSARAREQAISASKAVAEASAMLGSTRDKLCAAFRIATGGAHPACATYREETEAGKRSLEEISTQAWLASIDKAGLPTGGNAGEDEARKIRGAIASLPRDCDVDDNSAGETWRYLAYNYKREQDLLDKILRELASARRALEACSAQHGDALARSPAQWGELLAEAQARLAKAKETATTARDGRMSFDLEAGEEERLRKGVNACESKFGSCAIVKGLKSDCATIKEEWTRLKR